MIDNHSLSKRVLIVTNFAGFLPFLWDDIDILRQNGFIVDVATNCKLIDGSDAIETIIMKEKGICFHHVPFDGKNPFSKNNFKSYKILKKIMTNGDYCLVHCHTPIPGMLCRIIGKPLRKKGCKIIYTTHGFAFTKNSSKKTRFLYRSIENFLSNKCDAIITINKEDFNSAKKMRCKSVFYIHGVGLDVKKFHISIDKDFFKIKKNIPLGKKIILCVGEISKRKNHQVVIKAISMLPDKDDYCLVICGHSITNSSLKDELTTLSNNLGVTTLFLGHIKEIPEINHVADLVILPSVREGLGMAGLEGMASGNCVIGSDVQGIKDYVIEGENGFLFSCYDSLQLSKKISHYFSLDDVTIGKMKQRAIEVAKQYDISVSHIERLDIYNKVLFHLQKNNYE